LIEILDHKDAINRRQDEGVILVKTAIYRVFCFNRTVLGWVELRVTQQREKKCCNLHLKLFFRQNLRSIKYRPTSVTLRITRF
jgi:hypothetical protein